MKINDLIEFDGTYYPTVRDMTPEEKAEFNSAIPPEFEIEQLKKQLAESDYKAIKYAEGWYTEEEYAPIKDERQRLRSKINALEEE